jgi:DNA helicase-2/ATP-dependent DNA helicase PcrA
MAKFNDYKDLSMLEFSEFIRLNINDSIPKATKGKGKIFYENNTFQSVYLCVNISEDLSYHRTVHKAKGDEFDNVLLILKEEKDLKFMYEPDLYNYTQEEHRIYYVGASRAKDQLFISVPTLDVNVEDIIKDMVNIQRF